MNPLNSIDGTIVSGFVLAILIVLGLGTSGINIFEIEVWLHVLAGVVWIGLLYYFNFVQVPGVGQALAEANDGGPGPAAINKYVAPRALLWFRWSAVATWLTGVGALQNLMPGGTAKAFMLAIPALFMMASRCLISFRNMKNRFLTSSAEETST